MLKVKFRNWILVTLVGIFCISSYAQEATVTTGGDIQSAEGTVNYTIGQVLYSQQDSTAHSQIQGVQQPLEISVFTSVSDIDAGEEMTVSPNPANDLLVISMKEVQTEREVQLFDSVGKLISSQTCLPLKTQLDISHLTPGIYFMKITEGDQFIQTFKIIKY